MDCSLSAQTTSGSLDNTLSGSYCCGLDRFGVYLRHVIDF